MFSRSSFRFLMERGAGKARTRGNPAGDYATIADPNKAAAIPNYLKERFRLEKQKHVRDEEKAGTPRPRQYTMCSKCGLSTIVINFDAVPTARIGMFGTCKNGTDYTHHKFSVVTKEDYDMMKSMTKEERVQWMFNK